VAIVTIGGEKTWDLSKTVAGAALPESITVYLKHGDTIVDTAVVTEQDGAWKYSFTAPKYDAEGEEISYSVAEKPVTGFVATVDGYNITNVWQESRQVSVRKVWEGDDGNRPKSIQVQLYRDGKPSGTPVSLSAANGWKYIWSNLDSGSIWTVDEAALPKNYTKAITGDQNSGFVITNTYTDVSGGTSVTVAGKKTWKHGANPKAKQPQKITVQIKNGSYIVKQQTVSAAENWQWSFTLPRYDSRGEAIHYTVSEANVPGYKKTVSGYDITNTFVGARYPGDSPKTGDGGRPWLMILLMAASLAGAVAAWRYRRAA
jgi:hypothetical protein